MAVTKNVFLNGIAQIGNRTVRIAEQLLLVPFFLSMWGAAYYGEWLTLSIIPSVIALSDLGFGTAVSNHFVLKYSSGDLKESANIYKTGFIVISCCVLIGMVLSGGVIFVANKMHMLEKAVIAPTDMIVALVFLMGSRLVTFYSQLFEGFFRAKHKASVAFNLYTVEGFCRIGIGILSLFIGCRIVGYALGQFITALVFNGVFAIIALRNVKDLPSGHFKKDISIFTFKKGLGYMLTPIWQSIYMQGSTFVVRLALGPVAVAIFNTVRTVCQSIKSLYAIVNGAIYPELQIAYGQKNMKVVKSIYVYSIQIIFFFSISGYFFLMLLGPSIYSWWTKNELNVSNSLFYIFLLGIPLNALWWTAGTVFRAINKPMKFSSFGVISAFVATVFTYILAVPWGLYGAAIGFVLMDFIMVCCTFPLANKEVDVNMKDLFETGNLKYAYNRIFKKK